MSLSKSERQANVDFALQILLSQLNLEWIRTFTINPEDPKYENIYNTTWGELTDRYSYLERTQGVHNLYTLTPAGWFEALKITGLLKEGTDFNEQVGRLSATLKARVKGRVESALVELATVESETGIPRGIIANIIEIRYIDYELNRYGCHWAAGFEGRLIVVPTHFGLEVL